ncbi:MAG: DNA mismatch repair endonuclease MutL [Armatimonadota bacterium]|nr:MAG: DNA mismatch repair endonuclease MutL [Armatimonadota bacterium]
MSIVILDESIASKIAAGEVIERPASVVKELVENALDAGGGRVEVEVREAGRGLIRVTDDGRGMSREDAVLALQRYATSKIREAEDLSSVQTFGFRGEALPSIAAVSHMTMVTRAAGEAVGTRVAAVGGEVTELEEVGAPVGTQVSVSRLFYNTPARLKFLRRDAAEAGRIVETCTRFLFSHPETALLLRVEGREVIQHGGSQGLRGAVVAAWGREMAEGMIPVELAVGGMEVGGLVSGPSRHRASRNRQFLFVNRRWIRNRRLTHAVEEGYRGAAPEGRFPAAVVLLEVDPGGVDVNVHPTKAEVRLQREQEAHEVVLRAVREGLERAGGLTGVGLQAAASAGGGAGPPPQGELSGGASGAGGWVGTLGAPGVLSAAFQTEAGRGLELRPLAQLRQTYILAESRQGLLVVDQHRAQERVLYERFAEARLSRSGGSQVLLEPASVQLGAREAAALGEQMDELRGVGFEIEAFGRDAYLVRAVPVELKGEEAGGLVRDVAEELAGEEGERSVERRREKLLITLSCRSAVKAGDALSYEEMAALLGALSGTARPYTCPHGWPIVMTISNFEIDRRFNR